MSSLFNPGSKSDHAFMLAKHMPQGRLWRAVFLGDKNLGKLVIGLSVAYYRLSVLTQKVQEELDIDKTLELLSEWEKSVGIPDDCFTSNQSIEDRRIQIKQKLSNFGGVQKAEDFELVALLFGYDITVSPASAEYLFPLPFPFIFFDSVRAVTHTIIVKFNGVVPGSVFFPLDFPIQFESGAQSFLTCLFETLIPANMQLIFDNSI